MVAKLSAAALAALVDDLGVVKTQAAEISERESAIKEKLIAAGVPAIDGEFFRATVSHSEREVRDDVFKAFVEQLILKNTTPQYRRAHTRQVTQTSVRVVARVQRKAVS